MLDHGDGYGQPAAAIMSADQSTFVGRRAATRRKWWHIRCIDSGPRDESGEYSDDQNEQQHVLNSEQTPTARCFTPSCACLRRSLASRPVRITRGSERRQKPRAIPPNKGEPICRRPGLENPRQRLPTVLS
jgi:hypothetical protein